MAQLSLSTSKLLLAPILPPSPLISSNSLSILSSYNPQVAEHFVGVVINAYDSLTAESSSEESHPSVFPIAFVIFSMNITE